MLFPLQKRKRFFEFGISLIEQIGCLVDELLGATLQGSRRLAHLISMAFIVADHIGKKRLGPIGSGAFFWMMMVVVIVISVMIVAMMVMMAGFLAKLLHLFFLFFHAEEALRSPLK